MRRPPMRTLSIAVLPLACGLLAACGSVQVEDTNPAVDARPECTGNDRARSGEPLPPWCEREQSATWSSDSDDAPLDFSGTKKDD